MLLGFVVTVVRAADPFDFFQPVQPPRTFQVIAHRGQSRQAPENTRPALRHCLEDGLEWAEVDVRTTRDGHHVLSHGESLRGADGREVVVAERTLAELEAVDVGSAFAARFAGEAPLSLARCFELCRGRLNLYLDCKAVDPDRLGREIVAAGMERQVVVYDHPDRLPGVRAAGNGRIALMAKWRPGTTEDVAAWAASNHLAAVEIDADVLAPEIAGRFRALGVRVQAKVLGEWDRPEFWERAMTAGADWLQTDLPEEVLAYAYARANAHRPAGERAPVRFSLHRGAGRYAPENTIPAFEKAIRLGADFLEFDVRTTRDGRCYLLHDARLDRTTSGSGLLAEATAEAVAGWSAGVKFGREFAGVRLPTLESFLATVGRRAELYFDAKDIAPESLARALDRHGLADRTVVYQSPEYLLRLREIDPRIRALPPLRKPEELAALAARLSPYAVDANWNILSADLVARCHGLGIQVFSDALGEHETIENYRRAMDWGIDVIQTDHPLRLLRAMELREAGAGRRGEAR